VINLRLDIDFNLFRHELKNRILLSPMRSLPDLIIDLVVEQFERQLKELINSGEILRFKIGFKSKGESAAKVGSPDSHPVTLVLEQFT